MPCRHPEYARCFTQRAASARYLYDSGLARRAASRLEFRLHARFLTSIGFFGGSTTTLSCLLHRWQQCEPGARGPACYLYDSGLARRAASRLEFRLHARFLTSIGFFGGSTTTLSCLLHRWQQCEPGAVAYHAQGCSVPLLLSVKPRVRFIAQHILPTKSSPLPARAAHGVQLCASNSVCTCVFSPPVPSLQVCARR